jgi:hypothetical protein
MRSQPFLTFSDLDVVVGHPQQPFPRLNVLFVIGVFS